MYPNSKIHAQKQRHTSNSYEYNQIQMYHMQFVLKHTSDANVSKDECIQKGQPCTVLGTVSFAPQLLVNNEVVPRTTTNLDGSLAPLLSCCRDGLLVVVKTGAHSLNHTIQGPVHTPLQCQPLFYEILSHFFTFWGSCKLNVNQSSFLYTSEKITFQNVMCDITLHFWHENSNNFRTFRFLL